MTRLNWATLAVTSAAVALALCLPRLGSGAALGASAQDKPASAAKQTQPGVIVEDITPQQADEFARKARQAHARTAKPVQQPPARKPAPPAPKPKPAAKPAAPAAAAAPAPSSEDAAENVKFYDHAFPPTVSDTDYHQNAWLRSDCLRCHETGVGDAPRTRHKGMAAILFEAKCRSCHVFIRGSAPRAHEKLEDTQFASFAFPPMIPASASHKNAWLDDDCLLCHEDGVKGAPQVKHESAKMPRILLKSKCRTCHVQLRAASYTGGE